jgi:oxalate decarboxylase
LLEAGHVDVESQNFGRETVLGGELLGASCALLPGILGHRAIMGLRLDASKLPLPEVLAKNFGVAEQAFKNLPGKSPRDFAFRTMDMPPTKSTKGGEVRIVDSSTFKITTTTMAIVTVHPGGLRELHWHPNADEWQYFISGKGRMTVVSKGNRARTMDFQAGDVGYVEKTLLHYVENTGDRDLVFLEMFKSSFYQDLSFSEWLGHTPPELVMAHLEIDKATLDAMQKDESVILPR